MNRKQQKLESLPVSKLVFYDRFWHIIQTLRSVIWGVWQMIRVSCCMRLGWRYSATTKAPQWAPFFKVAEEMRKLRRTDENCYGPTRRQIHYFQVSNEVIIGQIVHVFCSTCPWTSLTPIECRRRKSKNQMNSICWGYLTAKRILHCTAMLSYPPHMYNIDILDNTAQSNANNILVRQRAFEWLPELPSRGSF